MELIKGSLQSVQNEVDVYLSKIEGTMLCHSKRSETAFYPKYNSIAVRLNIQICFTGDTWYQIIQMTNIESTFALAYIDSGEIDQEARMKEAAHAAVELFEGYGYKAVRAVLRDFGKILADTLGEFEIRFDRTYNENGLELNIHHNELEVLQDIDWIEDLIEEAGIQPRYNT